MICCRLLCRGEIDTLCGGYGDSLHALFFGTPVATWTISLPFAQARRCCHQDWVSSAPWDRAAVSNSDAFID